MDVKRGEIYSVDFDPPKGSEWKVGNEILKQRPAVVISCNGINKIRLNANAGVNVAIGLECRE